jgi:hypothetical protein
MQQVTRWPPVPLRPASACEPLGSVASIAANGTDAEGEKTPWNQPFINIFVLGSE